jgi:hypothetical protein
MSLEHFKQLSQQMYDLTNKECGSCRSKYSCCTKDNCEMTETVAQQLNFPLPEKINGMYMGPKGCILEPWQKPICTVHVCGINSNGTLGDEKKDEEYFRLREEMDDLLLDLSQ